MTRDSAIRTYAFGLVVFVVAASPAAAQFRPRPVNEPTIGERYHVEAAAGFWNPGADISISSEQFDIVGTTIDFKQDLGLSDQRFSELHVVLRPSTRHKFRFQYIPISYEQSATPTRDIVFNGIRYSVGIPINSTLDWKAFRFGYEYDFLTTSRGFGGVVLDFKYTDVTATLVSPIRSLNQYTHAKAPIPAIGGIFRTYVVPYVSITGEITGFKLPGNIVKNATAHYLDVDFYGTMNFTNNIGAQIGFRSFDVGYAIDKDAGDFTLKGLYFGVVARY